MTWTNKLWKFNTTPTAANMNNMQADITAKANGDTGAPKNKLAGMDTNSVDASQLVSGAITQAGLSTSTIEVYTIAPNTTSGLAASVYLDISAAGEYGLWPQVKCDASGSVAYILQLPTVYRLNLFPPPDWYEDGYMGTTYGTRIGFWDITGTGTSGRYYYVTMRYISASPPYDLGDGLCHLFIFCVLDKTTNEIIAVNCANDAPWHYGGPTNIQSARWEYVLQGDGFDHTALNEQMNIVRRKKWLGQSYAAEDFQIMRQWMDILPTLDKVSVNKEVPQSVKNADMNIVPHPFPMYDRDKYKVVMLDPVCDTTADLAKIQADGESVCDLFKNGFLKVTNTELARVTPNGVPTVFYRWK